jgi:hypothetical protein
MRAALVALVCASALDATQKNTTAAQDATSSFITVPLSETETARMDVLGTSHRQ